MALKVIKVDVVVCHQGCCYWRWFIASRHRICFLWKKKNSKIGKKKMIKSEEGGYGGKERKTGTMQIGDVNVGVGFLFSLWFLVFNVFGILFLYVFTWMYYCFILEVQCLSLISCFKFYLCIVLFFLSCCLLHLLRRN